MPKMGRLTFTFVIGKSMFLHYKAHMSTCFDWLPPSVLFYSILLFFSNFVFKRLGVASVYNLYRIRKAYFVLHDISALCGSAL